MITSRNTLPYYRSLLKALKRLPTPSKTPGFNYKFNFPSKKFKQINKFLL